MCGVSEEGCAVLTRHWAVCRISGFSAEVHGFGGYRPAKTRRPADGGLVDIRYDFDHRDRVGCRIRRTGGVEQTGDTDRIEQAAALVTVRSGIAAIRIPDED